MRTRAYIMPMKRITTLSAALVMSALPAMGDGENNDLQDGAQLLSEGTRLFLRGLLSEMEPMAEGWDKLLEMLNDLTLYEPPEVLENGDIIIRRKSPAAPQTGENGETDL